MPRDLPLANGHLLVNFDANYDLRDLYWPHIGERNHTEGHVNRFGVWVEGAFAWLDAPDWQRELRYEPETQVTQVTLTHPGLRLTLACADTVDFDRDLFIRKVRVTNLDEQAREVRLFYHQDWHLWENAGANTVYYHPGMHALIAYKDRCNVLVNGLVGDARAGAPEGERQAHVGVHHWATGYKEFNSQQGTWRDAEDGVLEGNPIAQGSVDSCVAFHLGLLDPGT
ncbi:MAG TPA: glycoside hydrolase family 15 protein, partial [Ktedonobacterales bacterium]